MAIFIVENSGKVSYGIKRYICKTMEDIPVEVNGEEIAPGSKIYVSDEKKTYMLNTAGQWVEITESSGGGASALSDLTDVNLSELADGQVLKYDGTSEKWVNVDQDPIFIEIEETLLAGQTSLTFEDDRIVTTSKVELFSKEVANSDIVYDDMTISTGRVVVTFPEQDSDIDVTLRLWLNNSGSLNITQYATDVSYDNTTSGLTSNDVQDALDEVNNKATDLDIHIRINMNSLTATINGYNTFDDFKMAIKGKRPNVIFSDSIINAWEGTSGDSGWANCLSHGIYVGDVAISYEKTGEQLLHSNDYVFIGAVHETITHSYVYPEAPNIKTTLIKIVFKDSLTGTVTKLQDADAIAYSKSISGTWVYDVKSALDTLDTKKANTSAIPTKTSDLINDSGFQSVKVLKDTLTAGETTITFTDSAIVDNKAYLVGSSIFGVMPTNVEVTPNTHTLTATFNAQQENIGVEVLII